MRGFWGRLFGKDKKDKKPGGGGGA